MCDLAGVMMARACYAPGTKFLQDKLEPLKFEERIHGAHIFAQRLRMIALDLDHRSTAIFDRAGRFTLPKLTTHIYNSR